MRFHIHFLLGVFIALLEALYVDVDMSAIVLDCVAFLGWVELKSHVHAFVDAFCHIVILILVF